MTDDGKPKIDKDGGDESATEELAENAEKSGEADGEEAVEDYVDSEETYSRDPDDAGTKSPS